MILARPARHPKDLLGDDDLGMSSPLPFTMQLLVCESATRPNFPQLVQSME